MDIRALFLMLVVLVALAIAVHCQLRSPTGATGFKTMLVRLALCALVGLIGLWSLPPPQ